MNAANELEVARFLRALYLRMAEYYERLAREVKK